MSSAEQPAEVPSGAPPPPADAGAATGAARASRSRRIWVRVILGLATVLAVFAIFAVWANRQLMDPHNWSRTSTALLQKETIRTALSGYLIDQLYANVNVPAQLQSGLPTQLRPLAGPLAGALHSVAEQGAERALAAPKVQDIWMKANYAADQALVAVVKGGGSRAQINGGTVSLNMRQIVADVADRLGLPSGVAEKLPASVATLKIVTSSELGLFRSLAKALHALAVVLVLLVLALYVLAMSLAKGYRRRTLLWVGTSLIFSGLIVLVGRKIGQGELVSAITSDASIEPAANDAYSVATSLMVQVASATIVIGVPVVLAAWFAGPARLAVSGRRFLAPHFEEHPGLAYGIPLGLLALVFVWGPIPATRNPWWMLLFIALTVFGAHILRGQIAAEFPDAQTGSMRDSLHGAVQAMGARAGRARAATAPPAAAQPVSKAAEIERLSSLHERGAITDEEFTAAKRELLSVS